MHFSFPLFFIFKFVSATGHCPRSLSSGLYSLSSRLYSLSSELYSLSSGLSPRSAGLCPPVADSPTSRPSIARLVPAERGLPAGAHCGRASRRSLLLWRRGGGAPFSAGGRLVRWRVRALSPRGASGCCPVRAAELMQCSRDGRSAGVCRRRLRLTSPAGAAPRAVRCDPDSRRGGGRRAGVAPVWRTGPAETGAADLN